MSASTTTINGKMFHKKDCKLVFALTLYCKDDADQQLPPEAVNEILQTMAQDSVPLVQIHAQLEQLKSNQTYAQWYHEVKVGRDSKGWEDLAHKAYEGWIERSRLSLGR